MICLSLRRLKADADADADEDEDAEAEEKFKGRHSIADVTVDGN